MCLQIQPAITKLEDEVIKRRERGSSFCREICRENQTEPNAEKKHLLRKRKKEGKKIKEGKSIFV